MIYSVKLFQLAGAKGTPTGHGIILIGYRGEVREPKGKGQGDGEALALPTASLSMGR
ncbi:MAG TPA: hypothetical protein VI137_13010 [Pseudolabrys sp.]|jgi:hypothetical protein